MNTIDEKLWNYIDGNCTADEQKAIKALIAQGEAYRVKYHELLKLSNELSLMELEEPPMAFTFNVMEAIRTEQAQQPLKAAVNKRIIIGITIFFVCTISALLIFSLSSISWTALPANAIVPANLKLPNISYYITKPVIEGFFFFDVILALFLFDTYLRRKKLGQAKF